MEHARHVLRVLFALVVILGVFIVGRSFAVPESYGFRGPYRYSNLQEQMDRSKPLHGGTVSCTGCHEDKVDTQEGPGHKSVNCEVCHGPLGKHANADKKIADALVDKSFHVCERCHQEIVGRPKDFPQVNLQDHVADVDEKLEGAVCLECHDAHSPRP